MPNFFADLSINSIGAFFIQFRNSAISALGSIRLILEFLSCDDFSGSSSSRVSAASSAAATDALQCRTSSTIQISSIFGAICVEYTAVVEDPISFFNCLTSFL